jgi:hypothetical protein
VAPAEEPEHVIASATRGVLDFVRTPPILIFLSGQTLL